MLWTIFVILLVLWLVGLVSFHAIGAYIHILLVIAVVVLLIQLISGRRSALYNNNARQPDSDQARSICHTGVTL